VGLTGIVLTVVAVVVGALVIAMVVAKVVVGRVRTSGAAAMEAEFAPGEVIRSDVMANFFGLSSLGPAQIRGTGVLVLAQSRLWFRRFGAGESLTFPLHSISSVELVKSHLGKAVGRPLVKVTTDTGESAAWYVKDAADWVQSIEEQRG
jgi:hypothetical protein